MSCSNTYLQRSRFATATALSDGATHQRSEPRRRPEVAPAARSRRLPLAARARSIDGRAVVVPSMVEVSKPSEVLVVTPSSVIPPVVLRALPQVATDGGSEKKANVTVSHSFSVVSVKYSTASDDLESPPPTLLWGEETEGKGEGEKAESLAEFGSDGGGDFELPVTAVLDLEYQHVPEEKEEAEEEGKGDMENIGGLSSLDVTDASPVIPAILKVAEIEGLGFHEGISAEDAQSRLKVVDSGSSQAEPDQQAFELDYGKDGGRDAEVSEVREEEIELYKAEGNADHRHGEQFTGQSEKLSHDAEASGEESDGEQMAKEEKVVASEEGRARVASNESVELEVAPEEAASVKKGGRAPKAVEVRPPASSSSLLHRVILRLAKNQTYDVVKGAGPPPQPPPFYRPLARHEQPPAFEFISVALHTTPPPPPPIQTTGVASSTTAQSAASSPATVGSTTAFAESATMSDDEFDERIYDAIINGGNGLASLAEGRQV